MIDEVDGALRAYLGAALPEEAEAPRISFEVPTPDWASSVTEPTLNLFLCDVRENLQARAGEWSDIRDDSGHVLARQPPVRRFDLAYLVSVWGAAVETEHALLGAVLTALPAYDSLPADRLVGRLADQDLAVGLRLGDQMPAWELWRSLDQPPRSSITLVATAPFRPASVRELAPPASSIDIGLAGDDGRAGRPPAAELGESAGTTPPRERRVAESSGAGENGKAAGWTSYRVRERPPPAGAPDGARTSAGAS